MLHACVNIVIPGRDEPLKISGSFRKLTGLKRRLGCRFKGFPVRFDFDRLPERRQRACRIAGLERGETSGQFQAVFVRGNLGLSCQSLELPGGKRWPPYRRQGVGEHLAEG